MLRDLDHPNIIRYFETYVNAESVSIVMEYIEGGELFDHITRKGKLDEAEASVIVR